MKQNQIRKSSTLSTNNKNDNHNTYQPLLRSKTTNLKIDLGIPFQPNMIKQKLFNNPSPVRPYERFIPTKIALTGVDPSGKINEFISHDIIHPLKKPDLYYQTFTIQNKENYHNNENYMRWALKTTARCNDYKSLPKLQPFTSYYLPPKYNNKEVEKYRKFTLKTDHIGIPVPRSEKVAPEKSFVKLKSDYYFNIETKRENEWVPFTSRNSSNNISSQNYDIINFKPLFNNNSNNNSHILNKTLYNKKKGIGEYTDLTKTFRVNFNKEFTNKLRDNPFRFRKYNGIFSDMYDSSHKNGDIIQPFSIKQKIK